MPKEVTREELLHDLRNLGEKYFGNSLYGQLSYQHELQDLIDQYTSTLIKEAEVAARVDEAQRAIEAANLYSDQSFTSLLATVYLPNRIAAITKENNNDK